MSAPKVAICIPYYRACEGPTLLSCMDLSARSAASVAMLPIGTAGCYIEDNRNGCIEYALATGIPFDWVLWIDSDMIFPGDALLRLLAHDKDIIGANYRIRTPPYTCAGIYHDRMDTHLLEPGLHRMAQMPTGLLLTRFDIYRRMGYPWFKPGLRSEPRDDIFFCRRALDLGYEIWCDHDLTKQVRHITVQEIGWFTDDQIKPVAVHGAQLDLEKSAEEGRKRASLSRGKFEAAQRILPIAEAGLGR